MNVLLVNPRSPYSFWTFDRTVDHMGGKALTAPLGLVTVAALLPREWNFKLIDLGYQSLTDDHWDWADLVMISGMIVQKESLIEVVREAKRRGKRVIVGGPYASLLPKEPLDAGADFVVVGEGETAIPGLLAAMDSGERGTIIHEAGKPDLTLSPVPRFDLLELSAYVTMAIQVSRGCPFHCEFCDIASLYGNKQRYKTPDQVVTELDALHALGWHGHVLVSDDNFIGIRKSAQAVLEKVIPWMKSHGEPFLFWTQTSVNLGKDVELIDLMTEANFYYVFLGIETLDEKQLLAAKKTHNIGQSPFDAVETIKTNGLSIIGSFIIGFDGETKGAGDRIVEFVEQANIPVVMVNTLVALPGTQLWKRLEKEGRLLNGTAPGLLSGEKMNFRPLRPEAEILQEIVDATKWLFEPSRYLERSYNYYMTMRPTRAAMAARHSRQSSNGDNPGLSEGQHRAPKDLPRLFALMWRHGVVAPYRWQFWRQLVSIYRHNPSRVVAYLGNIAVGENIFKVRNVIEERMSAR